MREHWTLDPDVRHLNHGSFGAVPAVTQQAQTRLQSAAEANPMRWFRELPARLVATRERIGDYLGVPGSDLALVPNATTGTNLALRAVGATAGQRIVLTSHTYGAIRLAAESVAAQRGCEVVVLDLAIDASDDDVVRRFEAVTDASTACLLVDQVTSATAKLMPVERLVALSRSRGVPVIVDGAHAPALLDEPVVGDFWTGNLHKWPCAPRGTGVLVVGSARQRSVAAPVVSWSDPLGFPLSFDLQGTTDATGWLAAPTALDLMTSLGFADRRKELGLLAEVAAEVFAPAIGGHVVDVWSPAPTMRLVSLPEGLVTDDLSGLRLAAHLAAATGVELAVTSWAGHGFIRLSAHLYNTMDDYTAAAVRLAPLFADRRALDAVVWPDGRPRSAGPGE